MSRAPAIGVVLLAVSLAGQAGPVAAREAVPSPVPGLRSIEALGSPEGQVDSGAGIYPALAPPALLAFPGQRALAAAAGYATARRGRVAFAVVDSRGGVAGRDVNARFPSASLTKAMLLVAFLRRAAAERSPPSRADRASLGYMILISDNGSADSVYAKVGDSALRDLARRAGMTRFEIRGHWASATLTPADQARFFLALDRLLPPEERSFARRLLETVTPAHSWGVPRVSRPRWRTFFKGGWRHGGEGELVHQGALLERGTRHLAIVVMTDGNPGQRYGEATVEGIARALLGRPSQQMLRVVPAPAPPLQAIEGLDAS